MFVKLVGWLLLSVLGVNLAHADVIAGLGMGVRYERAGNADEYHTVYPLTLEGGYAWDKYAVLGEYLNFTDTNDIGPDISVKQSHQGLALWLRRSILSEDCFGFFAGLGIGSFRERADTSFIGTNTTNASSWTAEYGLQVGWWGRVIGPVFVEILSSARFSSAYYPNPELGINGALGVAL